MNSVQSFGLALCVGITGFTFLPTLQTQSAIAQTASTFSLLRKGMTEQQVKRLLGEPSSRVEAKGNVILNYNINGRIEVVKLRNGRVIQVGGMAG